MQLGILILNGIARVHPVVSRGSANPVKKIQSRDNAATLANNRRIGSSATKKGQLGG
jgi:hypothetical protein